MVKIIHTTSHYQVVDATSYRLGFSVDRLCEDGKGYSIHKAYIPTAQEAIKLADELEAKWRPLSFDMVG